MANEIRTLFQLFGQENSLNMTIKATNSLRKMTEKVEEMDSLSPKARKLKELCISYGPSGAKLAQCFSIVLGEEITIDDLNKNLPFVKFACIIPTTTKEGHNYKVGEPMFMIVCCSGNKECPDMIRCLKCDGGIGNNYIPVERITTIATEEQVIQTINKIFKNLEKKEGGGERLETG